jgi:ubiquinol-cytochrome c reductase cytochrome c1 subunit
LVNFLQWAAEPEMEQRKRMGIKIIFFLAIASLFFYLAKRKIWSDVH